MCGLHHILWDSTDLSRRRLRRQTTELINERKTQSQLAHSTHPGSDKEKKVKLKLK